MKTQAEIETVVISGFPGTGKSYFVDNGKGSGYMPDKFAIDSDSSTFDKAHFPDNYIQHIKDSIGKVKIVFVSSHKEVREALVSNDIPFTLVYPNKQLKIEYIKRYIQRGSPDGFIDLLYGNWNQWIEELENQKGCKHLVLNEGEYMSNRKIF